MDTFSGALEVFGLLAILASGAITFTNLIRWLGGSQRTQHIFGVQQAVFFSIIYLLHGTILDWIEVLKFRVEIDQGLATSGGFR